MHPKVAYRALRYEMHVNAPVKWRTSVRVTIQDAVSVRHNVFRCTRPGSMVWPSGSAVVATGQLCLAGSRPTAIVKHVFLVLLSQIVSGQPQVQCYRVVVRVAKSCPEHTTHGTKSNMHRKYGVMVMAAAVMAMPFRCFGRGFYSCWGTPVKACEFVVGAWVRLAQHGEFAGFVLEHVCRMR